MHTNRDTMPTATAQAEIARLNSPLEEARVTMLYDGGCSLCRSEVTHYRRIDRAERVQWVDISADPGLLASVGIRYDEAMARLHVVDRSGKVQTGAWAFAAVWDALPYYRWLARIVRALRLLPAIDVAYVYFARWRLKRRGCDNKEVRPRRQRTPKRQFVLRPIDLPRAAAPWPPRSGCRRKPAVQVWH